MMIRRVVVAQARVLAVHNKGPVSRPEWFRAIGGLLALGGFEPDDVDGFISRHRITSREAGHVASGFVKTRERHHDLRS